MTAFDPEAIKAVKRALCLEDHLFFTRNFFKSREGIKFKVNWHHKEMSNAIQRVIDGQCKRLIINVPPGSSKTEMAVINLIARGLAINPRARFLHLSYSSDLAELNSAKAKELITSTEFQELFPIPIKTDSNARGRWNVVADDISIGGCYATSTLGQVTGFRAGHMAEGFQGCFPAWQMVETNLGHVRIDELSDFNGEVASYDSDSGKKVFLPIDRHWINPANDIIRIKMSDGTSFDCTPDHEILSESGWVAAIHFANALNLANRQSSKPHCIFPSKGSVIGNLDDAFGVLWLCIPSGIREILCDRFPGLSHLYLTNYAKANTVSPHESGDAIRALEYLNNLYAAQLCAGPTFENWECSVPQSILHVVGLCAVREIGKAIVQGVSVQMPDFVLMGPFSYELLRNEVRNVFDCDIPANRKANSQIPLSVATRLKRSNGNCPADLSKVRNLVKPIGSTDSFPISVEYICHVNETFCLTVGGDNNFIVSETGAVVSNCIIIDDPLKPVDSLSKVKRDAVNNAFINTVQSRKASPDTPIIVIMQRLADEDLTGFLLKGGDGKEWEHVCIPAIDEGGDSYWPEKEPIESLLQLKEKGNFTFEGQYQQRPYVLGGELIKGEWFGRYSELPGWKEHSRRAVFADTAMKTGEANDYTVFLEALLCRNGKVYILNVWRKKVNAVGLLQLAKDVWSATEGKAQAMYIEDKASGTGLIQQLQTTAQFIPVIPVQRTIDKLTRVMEVQPRIQAGGVMLPESAPWVVDFISECEAFTANDTHKHDDQVDPLVDAVNTFMGSGGGMWDVF